ncbi:MAG TPA: cytochrome P450, partial [Actinomycetota bacterium]
SPDPGAHGFVAAMSASVAAAPERTARRLRLRPSKDARLLRGRRPPGPGTSPFGNLRRFGRDPIAWLQRVRRFGDVAFFWMGPFDVYLVSDPELIKEVLVTNHRRYMKGQGLQEAKRLLGDGLLTSEGEFHRRQRRLVQPAFHRSRVDGYSRVMVDYADGRRSRWRDGQVVDVHREMNELTLAIVGKTLFDADVEGADARRVRDSLAAALELFDRLTSPLAPLVDLLPLPSVRRFNRARAALDGIIFGMIEDRRAIGEDRGDLLSMLLAAQDEEGDDGVMTDRQVRDEATTLFLAGHETTANALSWTWYLLSQYPEAEAKLHAELASVLGDRLPSVEDLPSLRYTRMVLSEALRLYPPAWVLGRRALDPHELGGWTIPAGGTVLMCQYLVHHDPRWYPDPYRFDPERWTEGAEAARPKFAYFPFGGGPRLCIGESFAWMEGALVLAAMAARWRLRLVPDQQIALHPRITLRPRSGLLMRLERN